MTVYEGPLRRVIDDVTLCFKPYGYHISAPVFDYLDDPDTLERELKQDAAYGLWSKSAIHPTQVPIIERSYRVSAQEIEVAQAILRRDADAVFKGFGQMIEPAVHRPWALQAVGRSTIYDQGQDA
jgi:citrate lyase beta subunit